MSGFHDEDGYEVPAYVIEQSRPLWSAWPDESSEDMDGALQAAMALLTPKQRFVLARRYGYGDARQEPQTLQEVADVLGISRQKTHDLEQRALAALRRILAS